MLWGMGPGVPVFLRGDQVTRPHLPETSGSLRKMGAAPGPGQKLGVGSLTNTPFSAWYLRPSHLLLTPTWPLPSPLLPVLTLYDTHSFTHSFVHSFMHQVSVEPFP